MNELENNKLPNADTQTSPTFPLLLRLIASRRGILHPSGNVFLKGLRLHEAADPELGRIQMTLHLALHLVLFGVGGT
jgi:hypothetical protein